MGDLIETNNRTDRLTYSLDIPIRGYLLSLNKIKEIYRELNKINNEEGKKEIATLPMLEGEAADDFSRRKDFLLDDAFRVTVSILGYEGEEFYGENETVFDSQHLPNPIKIIYFTNKTAFARHANGNSPPNQFDFWFHFDKPTIFDPDLRVSHPTPNPSKATVNASDVGFFRAVQSIVKNKLSTSKRKHSFIHERFTYDIGLWVFFLPLSLYWITIFNDYYLPTRGDNSSFRVAFFICCTGVSLMIYRGIFEYMKWAFPVNTLEENKDSATRHRFIFGFIFFGLLGTTINTFFGKGLESLWLF